MSILYQRVSNGISYLIRIETEAFALIAVICLVKSQMAFPILLGLKQLQKAHNL